jgi:hypothetical protein
MYLFSELGESDDCKIALYEHIQIVAGVLWTDDMWLDLKGQTHLYHAFHILVSQPPVTYSCLWELHSTNLLITRKKMRSDSRCFIHFIYFDYEYFLSFVFSNMSAKLPSFLHNQSIGTIQSTFSLSLYKTL